MSEESLKRAAELFGDAWHTFRVALAEHFLWVVIVLMPDGPEKRKMDECIYEYVLWAKDGE